MSFRQPTSKLVPGTPDGITRLDLDFIQSIPEMAESMDGWEVINSQVMPLGTDELLLILFLRTSVDVEALRTEG